jgi:hypothetical protein
MPKKADTTISINGGPEVPIDLAMKAVDHIKGQRKGEAVPFTASEAFTQKLQQEEKKISDALLFQPGNREVVLKHAENALTNMLYSKFAAAWEALKQEAKEQGGVANVQMQFKFNLASKFGRFAIDELAVKWIRKVGEEDKDFDAIVYDPAQPELPGLNGGDK